MASEQNESEGDDCLKKYCNWKINSVRPFKSVFSSITFIQRLGLKCISVADVQHVEWYKM